MGGELLDGETSAGALKEPRDVVPGGGGVKGVQSLGERGDIEACVLQERRERVRPSRITIEACESFVHEARARAGGNRSA
jgi:hypothetical protein